MEDDAPAEQVEADATVHLPLDHLDMLTVPPTLPELQCRVRPLVTARWSLRMPMANERSPDWSSASTVHNGMNGHAHHMATGISPTPTPLGRDLCGGGLSGPRQARSGHLSQDTLARKTFPRWRRVQSGDQPIWNAVAFAR
jgi:hypothetical protein